MTLTMAISLIYVKKEQKKWGGFRQKFFQFPCFRRYHLVFSTLGTALKSSWIKQPDILRDH